jgi:uncharacterized RDD family membrane protein YckC
MIMRMNHSTNIVKPLATPAHLGWRLLAISYDAFIALALLMFSSAIVLLLNAGSTISPGSFSSFLAFVFFWLTIGAYAILSWRSGGQTLGMRPWRLKVLSADGSQPSWKSLCIRYVIGSCTLGLGVIWSLFDKDRRAVYDIASGTLLVRLHPIKSA